MASAPIRQRVHRDLRGLIATALTALSAAGCVPDNHPLGGGSATFLYDAEEPIFAADVLDEKGRPVRPRQRPFQKRIQIRMLSEGAPDRGAFVDLEVRPPGSVELVVDETGTCEQLPGVFRCTAEEDGLASFIARSSSDWSGQAEIAILDRDTSDTATLEVLPAGLPRDAPNFVLVLDNLAGNSIPARFNSLSCTIEPVPDAELDKWPEGTTRVREAQVRASPPPQIPGALEHAPVIVESQSPEAFLSRDAACPPPRDSRIRVQLDELGLSPKLYVCFSDIGGEVRLGYHAGVRQGEPIDIDVAPEPRLLRVLNVVTELSVGQVGVPVVNVTAFDADLDAMGLSIDVRSTDPQVLQLEDLVVTLPPEDPFSGTIPAAEIDATANAAGQAAVVVTPTLFSEPACSSMPITVNP